MTQQPWLLKYSSTIAEPFSFRFLSALSGIGARGNHPQESGLQTPPTKVIRDN